MKLKCVTGYEAPSNGFLGLGAHGRKPIDGLTEGKEYSGEVCPLASGQYTSTTVYFLIYNDNKEWETYDLNLFTPV